MPVVAEKRFSANRTQSPFVALPATGSAPQDDIFDTDTKRVLEEPPRLLSAKGRCAPVGKGKTPHFCSKAKNALFAFANCSFPGHFSADFPFKILENTVAFP